MINFFRKTRKNLADTNPSAGRAGKPMKYMRYAIGEIVLVVIGILIALSINNWNQNAANKLKVVSILEQIERELLDDVQTAHKLNLRWLKQDSLYHIAISDSASIEMYRESFDLRALTYYTEQNTIQMNGFELLKQNANLIEESLNPLLSKMSKMYTYYSQEFALNLENQRLYRNNKDYEMAKNYAWFHKNRLSDEWLEFFTTSSAYKNQLSLYKNIVISPNLGDSRIFMSQAVEILQSIEEVQTGKKVNLETLWSKIVGSFKGFQLKPCQENMPPTDVKSDSDSNHQIFTNSTSEPVEIRIIHWNGKDFFHNPFNHLESGESFKATF